MQVESNASYWNSNNPDLIFAPPTSAIVGRRLPRRWRQRQAKLPTAVPSCSGQGPACKSTCFRKRRVPSWTSWERLEVVPADSGCASCSSSSLRRSFWRQRSWKYIIQDKYKTGGGDVGRDEIAPALACCYQEGTGFSFSKWAGGGKSNLPSTCCGHVHLPLQAVSLSRFLGVPGEGGTGFNQLTCSDGERG